MINSHFLITIFDYDIEDNNSWSDITDFIEIEGSNNLDNYLSIETDFIKAIQMFNNFFSKNEYFDSLVTKIEVYENGDDFNFYDLDGDYQKLLQLSKSNFSSLSDSDKEFIYRCQCRRMCSLWFIDVVSMSYLTSAMDPFFLHLYLNLTKHQLSDIFKIQKNIFYYYDQDHLDDSEDYILPDNCGVKIQKEAWYEA